MSINKGRTQYVPSLLLQEHPPYLAFRLMHAPVVRALHVGLVRISM